MRCSNLNEVFAQPKSWAEALDLEPATVAYLMDPDWESVDATLKWAEAAHHWVLTKEDEDYPILLKDLPDAPPLLYVAGEPSYLNDPQIAMVGSRQMSAYGQENAKQFATDLAEKGFTITSGLALGIDGISHQSALDAGGTTIAVMATGMDQIYPATHLKLAHRILEQGCLVSEMPLGSGADKRHFPRRNRIISGLSLGVLVVEAALQSGSLITARFANEQNREVFTIPGSIH
ncbi:MAG: DNA-protecting protein DprA, partial [Gammaproteobacteria bacterium]|nr:DNA-protecting protein DprA [Gammaproteobacteria bacterium]